MNYNGRFSKAISKQVCQARRAMFSVLGKIKKLNLSVDIACELFDSLVLPIALYGSEVWGFESITQDVLFMGRLGKYKLASTVNMKMIHFWCRLLSGKQTKLSCTLYRLLKKMHEDGENLFHSKWIAKVKSILESSGLGNVWS